MKNQEENNVLNSTRFNNYTTGFNWLIPVATIIFVVVWFILVTKDFTIFNLSNASIEEILNIQKPF